MMLLGIENYAVDQKEPLSCCGHLRLLKEYFEELRSFMAPLDCFLLIVLFAEMAYTDLLSSFP